MASGITLVNPSQADETAISLEPAILAVRILPKSQEGHGAIHIQFSRERLQPEPLLAVADYVQRYVRSLSDDAECLQI